MTPRLSYATGLTVVILLLLTSLYYQFFQGIMPCPLCTLQRIDFVLLGISFLLGIIFHTKRAGRIIINTCACVFSLVGIFLSGRQVWLQHYPSANANECGVSLQYMMQALPLNELFAKIFQGTAECTARGWEFLSFNMAEWALIWFGLFLLMSVYLCVKEFSSR